MPRMERSAGSLERLLCAHQTRKLSNNAGRRNEKEKGKMRAIVNHQNTREKSGEREIERENDIKPEDRIALYYIREKTKKSARRCPGKGNGRILFIRVVDVLDCIIILDAVSLKYALHDEWQAARREKMNKSSACPSWHR